MELGVAGLAFDGDVEVILVDEVGELLDLRLDRRISINPRRITRRAIPIDREVTVRELLTHFLELRKPATRSQLLRLAAANPCPPERAALTALADDPEQSAIRDISLSLDVAQVHRTEQPFARLREVGAALAEAMDGVLCDQNGQPLPAMAMDPIAADLELLYDQLDARDLSAGSVLARRLFS